LRSRFKLHEHGGRRLPLASRYRFVARLLVV
jgi:hypothetical protein